MKTTLILFLISFSIITNAQDSSDSTLVNRACLNYIEGFYNGDTSLLIASLSPELNKFGYWKIKETGEYNHAGKMSFEEAKNYARNVAEKKHFVSEKAPKKVELLDLGNTIAAAKVT